MKKDDDNEKDFPGFENDKPESEVVQSEVIDTKELNQDLPVGANPLHKILIHPDTAWK